MKKNKLNIHFIAIGGAVMHNLALELHSKGHRVTGSDDEIYDPARSRLEKEGLLPEAMGWYEDKITPDLDYIILGMHARADNPELLKAQSLGLNMVSFPEFVFQQSKDKTRVVIAGSHGKTSITSMILHVLKYYEKDFDYLVGAIIDGFDLMVRLSDSAPVIIIEGDEYLASPLEREPKFLFYHPHIALVSGIAWDHFNVFPTFESYVDIFNRFNASILSPGALLYDETDEEAAKSSQFTVEGVDRIPYKAYPYYVKDGKTFLKTPEGDQELSVFGEHNMKNLNGARIICNRLGISDQEFFEAIQSFTGAAKRLETLGKNERSHILRDFAHAPSKVEATTNAVKNLYEDRELVAVYELHTFSSLNKDFLPHYKDKLNSADLAIVFFSPHTLEMKRMPAISEEEIKTYFGREDLIVMNDAESLKRFISQRNWVGSNLLLMSSGTYGGLDLDWVKSEILN